MYEPTCGEGELEAESGVVPVSYASDLDLHEEHHECRSAERDDSTDGRVHNVLAVRVVQAGCWNLALSFSIRMSNEMSVNLQVGH